MSKTNHNNREEEEEDKEDEEAWVIKHNMAFCVVCVNNF